MTIGTIQPAGGVQRPRIALRLALVLVMMMRGWARVLLQSEKSRTRKDLFELTDAQLEDIGVTRAEARREACQSFWR